MKKLSLVSGLLLLLAACNGETNIEENINDEDTSTDTEEVEDDNNEETDAELTASDIIQEAKDRHGDVVSYELVQTLSYGTGDDSLTTTTSTMLDEDTNLHFSVTDNQGGEVNHFYLANDESFTEDNGEFQDLAVDISNNNATYGDLLDELDAYDDAEVSTTDEGYVLTLNIDSYGDLSGFLDNEAISQLDENSESISGNVEITFDDDYVYIGALANLTIETEEETLEVTSDIEIMNVGNIDFIVLPEGAPATLDSSEGDEADTDEETGDVEEAEDAADEDVEDTVEDDESEDGE